MAMLAFFALIKNKNSVSNSKDLFPYNSLEYSQSPPRMTLGQPHLTFYH